MKRNIYFRAISISAVCFFAALPVHAQNATSDQCSEQMNSFQGMFNSMQSSGGESDPQAGIAAMASMMSQLTATMGQKNSGADAMLGLFQDMVSSMSGLTNCRRTQVDTIKTDYQSGAISKDEAKERLTYVKKDVQEDNQKIEQVRLEVKEDPKSAIANDPVKAEAVNEAAQDHQAVEQEIDDLFSALDA